MLYLLFYYSTIHNVINKLNTRAIAILDGDKAQLSHLKERERERERSCWMTVRR